MTPKIEKVKQILLEKSSVKQLAYRQTKESFAILRESVKQIALVLNQEVAKSDPTVEIKYYEKSDYEFHLKFSGDTLVFMMHTNVFDFDSSHFIHQTPYVKTDPSREFCGMIQIYNFLADSIKYNREGDVGYLVGRLFINKDQHFFIDGNRPLSFMFSNFAENQIGEQNMSDLVTECMQFCLHYDLMAPPIEAVFHLTVEQKNIMSYSSGIPTSKAMGFRMESDEKK